MSAFNPYKLFQTGKHTNKTYWWVWQNDKDYLYYLASQYSYWHEVVEYLENRDKFINPTFKRRPTNVLSVEDFKLFFKQRPIMGFDMSDFLTSVYEKLNDLQKEDYFESLKKRNNL